ncbi:hypothetical protein BpHYR1_044566 [Brachionus plicatilis]|uniref:Uncharacterized protein n=1 Tax=Brachionus plicatilis TaxID=10195 RepID=A0A3M7R1F8_BRAPC|nr:hypothetical protein BpHYR1_044566 [Brachionus plicatilis]
MLKHNCKNKNTCSFNIKSSKVPEDRGLLEGVLHSVFHAKTYWVVISNYNPSDPTSYQNWYIYESLNNPKFYLNNFKKLPSLSIKEKKIVLPIKIVPQSL